MLSADDGFHRSDDDISHSCHPRVPGPSITESAERNIADALFLNLADKATIIPTIFGDITLVSLVLDFALLSFLQVGVMRDRA